MKNRLSIIVLFTGTLYLAMLFPATGQQKTTQTPDLTQLVKGKGWKVFNRKVSALNDRFGGPARQRGVHLDEREGDGGAWLENYQFANGEIEFDVKGKDVLQQSFVGIAFHVIDSTTFDAIYFRPFNFKAADPVRKSHAVQYISMPGYDWQKLRNEQPNKYEQPVEPALDPNDWVHVRVVVNSGKVAVFVNDAKAPSLTVEQLSHRPGGMVGFWVGNNSAGDFANLKISPK